MTFYLLLSIHSVQSRHEEAAEESSAPPLRFHTFESVHDVLVLFHLQGVDLVSGISGSRDSSHLELPEPAGGRREEGLSWKQATGTGHGAGSGARFEKLSLIAVPMS